MDQIGRNFYPNLDDEKWVFRPFLRCLRKFLIKKSEIYPGIIWAHTKASANENANAKMRTDPVNLEHSHNLAYKCIKVVNRLLFSYCSISSFIDASIDFNFSPYRSFTNELNNKIITYLSVNYQVSRDLLVSGPVVLNRFLLPGSNSLLGTIIWELISKRAKFIKGLNRSENGTLQIIFTKAVNSISKLHYEIRFFHKHKMPSLQNRK